MGLMSAWNNHRSRQAGKYSKRTALVQQPYAALPMQSMPAPPPPTPPAAQARASWSAGFEQGRRAGWEQGWRAGQRDLIDALRTGRVRWEDVSR